MGRKTPPHTSVKILCDGASPCMHRVCDENACPHYGVARLGYSWWHIQLTSVSQLQKLILYCIQLSKAMEAYSAHCSVSQLQSSSIPQQHTCLLSPQTNLMQLIKGLMISWQVEPGVLSRATTKMYAVVGTWELELGNVVYASTALLVCIQYRPLELGNTGSESLQLLTTTGLWSWTGENKCRAATRPLTVRLHVPCWDVCGGGVSWIITPGPNETGMHSS